MFTENEKSTIFDDVKPKKITHVIIPENEIIKPTKCYSIKRDGFDTKLIVDGYKLPTFKFIYHDSLNDFYDFPDITISKNPIYKYKYPKLITAETIKEQKQTEEVTSHELNRFLRQGLPGKTIEDIQQFDNAYEEGLAQIKEMIENDSKKIKQQYKIIEDYKNLTDLQRKIKNSI